MRFLRRKSGLIAPEVDPVDERAREAAEKYGFDEHERAAHAQLQRALAKDPALRKQVARRIRKLQAARGMSPTISTKRRK